MMDVDAFVKKIDMEESVEIIITPNLKELVKGEIVLGRIRAKIMTNNREILKLERKIRKDYLECKS